MGSRHRKKQAPSSAPNRIMSSRSAISLGSPESPEPPTGTTNENNKKRSRILSGLHPSQDVIGGMPLPWESQDSTSPNPPPPSSRYTTRGTLNGFQPGIYDNRFHPMDKVLRPKASAKRERRLKAQSRSTINSETEQSDGENQCIALSSGSGSDIEDTDDDSDAGAGPIVPFRKYVSTRRSQRTRQSEPSESPLYNAKKHPIDDILEDSDHQPRLTKKPRAPRSSGTIHADTPRQAAGDNTTAASLTHVLGDAPYFPDEAPSSIQETIQRVMALVREANQLIPLFPALEAHLQKVQETQIQVYEDRDVLERIKPQCPVFVHDDFEKENIRETSRTSNADDNHFSNNGSDLRIEYDEQSVHSSGVRPQSEDIDHPRRRISTQIMLPPRTPIPSSTLQDPTELLQSSAQPHSTSSQMRDQRLHDPPSTGVTPTHTQIGDVPPPEVSRSGAVLTAGHYNARRRRTVRDTHLTVSQSEVLDLESSQIGTQLDDTQVTLPPSDNDALE